MIDWTRTFLKKTEMPSSTTLRATTIISLCVFFGVFAPRVGHVNHKTTRAHTQKAATQD